MDVVDRMVKEWGLVDDSLLFGSRMDFLFKEKSGLKLRTDGYQWMKQTKVKASDKIIKVDPRGKYTISESSEFKLGKVDQIWVVASSENTMTDMSLKRLAKLRITLRGEPEFDSFDHYMAIRTSCWILEYRNGQFFGDCPIGMKVKEFYQHLLFYINIFQGKLCKHTVGMSYMEGILDVTSQVRAVPLGQKRKRGRPKGLGNCLLKSPPLTRAPLCVDSPADTQTTPPPHAPGTPPTPDQPSTCCPDSPSDQPLQSTSASTPCPDSPTTPPPVYAPAMRKSRQSKKDVPPVSPRRTRRTVVSTLARKSPVKRKAVSPVKDVPIARKLRTRK